MKLWMILIGIAVLLLIPLTSKIYGIAALIGPVLILVYTYKSTKVTDWLILLIVMVVVSCVSMYRIIPGGIVPVLITVLFSSVILMVLLLLNKWVFNHSHWLVAILFYPILMTGFEYFMSYGSPFSTFNSPVYSLFHIRSIIMWTSVGGIWLLLFIMNLIIAMVARGFYDQTNIYYIVSGVMVVVLLVGGMLMTKTSSYETLKTTGLTPHRIKWQHHAGELFSSNFKSYDWSKWDGITSDLINRTHDAVKKGSKMVVWAEGATTMTSTTEASLINEMKEVSRDNEVILILAYILYDQQNGMDNKMIVINTKGEMVVDYKKVALVFGETKIFNQGTEPLPVIDTIYGRIAVGICYDVDLPSRVLLAGQKKPELLVIPASDWDGITPYHTTMSAVRGIENNMAVLRVTKSGMSAVYDNKGTTLGQLDDFKSDNGSTFDAEVPFIKSKATVYQSIGDWLPLICLGLTIILPIITWIMKRKKSA